MKERKELIEGLEYCIKAKDKNCPMACPFFKECFSVFTSTEPFYPIMHAVLEFLKEQPDIVRCKDCKYGEQCIPPCEDRYCVFYDQRHDGDWFCGDGEVRQDE